jgi:uncharacterized protein YwgA
MAMREELVKKVLQAADGRIVGRIRLQKIFYLLEQFGMGSGFRFSYHHYGPYSEELSSSVMRAQYLDKFIREDEELTSYGAPYSVYTLSVEEPPPEDVGSLPFETARNLLAAMKSETSVVLELAATIHWLKEKEKIANWQEELRTRKPTKATPDLTGRAEALLAQVQAAAA